MADELRKSLRMQPRLRTQAIMLYDSMRKEAVTQDDGRIIWTGSFVKATESVGVAKGSYQKFRQKLERLGCITFIQRGNGMRSSVILLGSSPFEVDWSAPRGKDLTATEDAAILSQQIADIGSRLGNIDVVQALVALTEEDKNQEQKIRKLQLTIRRLAVELGIDPKTVEVE